MINSNKKNNKLYSLRDIINGVFFSFSELFTPISFLILIPIFVKYLGIEKYGLWVLIFSIANFSKIASSGISTGIIRLLNNSSNNQNQSNLNFSFIFLILSIVLAFFLLSIIIFYFNLIPINNEFKNDEISILILLAITFTLLKIIEQNLLSVPIAYQEFILNIKLSLFSKFIIFVLSIFLIIFYQNIKLLLFINTIAQSIILIIEVLIINKIYKIFKFEKLNKKQIIKNNYLILNFIKGLFINNLITITGNNIDKIIVNTLLGLETLAFYNIAFSIYQIIHSAYSSFFFVIYPKILKIKSKKVMFQAFIKSQIYILFFGFIGLFFIFLFSEKFIQLWLNFDFNYKIINYLNLFLIINLLMLPSIVIYYFLMTSKNTNSIAKYGLYSTILTISLMFILGIKYSVIGIIFSRASVIFIYFFSINELLKNFKKNNE